MSTNRPSSLHHDDELDYDDEEGPMNVSSSGQECPYLFRSAVIGPEQPVFQLQQIHSNTDAYSLQDKQFHNNDDALLEVGGFDTLKQQQQKQQQRNITFVQQQQKQQQLFYSSKAAASASTASTATYASFFDGGGWKLPRLTRLSMFHPLEQCHVSFPKHVLLSHMLPALLDVFQKTSLLVTNFTDSPIGVSCESMERVSFQVWLWQSRQHADTVILEIQKVSGDAIDFQTYAQHILATARAVVVAAATTAGTTTTTTTIFEQQQTQLPASLQEQQQQQKPFAPFVSQEMETEEDDPVVGWSVPAVVAADRIWNGDCEKSFNQEQATTEALEILHSILYSDRYDACRLGLESACCMTDPCKTGWSTACMVSQALLAPTNVMQKEIAARILRWTLQSSVAVGGRGVASDEAHQVETTNWQVQELSYLALQSLAQALQVAVEAQKMTAVSTFLDTTCGDQDLVAFLLNKVRTVQQSPHTAYFAIRALTALCQAIPEVSQRIAHQDVEYAQQVGVATHAALAKVSGRLLVTLLHAC